MKYKTQKDCYGVKRGIKAPRKGTSTTQKAAWIQNAAWKNSGRRGGAQYQ